MAELFIQDTKIVSNPPTSYSALQGNKTSGRAGFPALINELNREEFGALGKLAAHSYVLRNKNISLEKRYDVITKYAQIPPDTIFIPKSGLFGSNILIRKTPKGNNEVFTVYWDVNAPQISVDPQTKIPKATGQVDTDTSKAVEYNSLEDLVDAINTHTFPQANIGSNIKLALQQRGYVQGDTLKADEVIKKEDPKNGILILSKTEQEAIWSTLRIAYDNLGASAGKNTILRQAMVRFGRTLIARVFADNNSGSTKEKKEAAVFIGQLWEDSKALRNTPTLHSWEEGYDRWVKGLLSELDKDILRDILQQEADAIMEKTRQAIAGQTTVSDMTKARQDGENALQAKKTEADRNDVKLDMDKYETELADYQRLIDAYDDASQKMRKASTGEVYDKEKEAGKSAIDRIVKTPPDKYPADSEIRQFAEKLKTDLDNIAKPRVQPPPSLDEVLRSFRTKGSRYKDILSQLTEYGETAAIRTAAETYHQDINLVINDVNDYFSQKKCNTNAQKIAAIQKLESDINKLDEQNTGLIRKR